MPSNLSSTAIEALRSTLKSIEEQAGLAADDPSLLELKRILLARISALQAAEYADAAQRANEAATTAALELATATDAESRDDPAVALALNLAVSLLAEPRAGRALRPATPQTTDPTPPVLGAVPDQPPLDAVPAAEIPVNLDAAATEKQSS